MEPQTKYRAHRTSGTIGNFFNALLPKSMFNIALMATVLPAPVSVNRENFAAMLASDFMVCFPLHLIEMSIPPLIPAFIAAKFP